MYEKHHNAEKKILSYRAICTDHIPKSHFGFVKLSLSIDS